MIPERVPRFPFLIRVVGAIIAIPSAIGIGFGVGLFLSFVFNNNEYANIPGALFVCVLISALSAVFGLAGWLILVKKKAFVCGRCGYMLDRN